jgi:hypothetical protein
MLRAFSPLAIVAILLTGAGASAGWAQTPPPKPVSSNVGGELTSDFKYLANNFEADGEDIVTAPLHLEAAGAMLTNPRFYLIVAGAGAVFGGSFALDQTMRSHLRSMGSSTADLLQNVSYGSVGAATALLYGYGLYSGESRARQYALTAGEGAGIVALVDIGIKAAFGRLRPSQSPSHTAFFHGGQSFVSGDVAPMFALAAGVSEYYDNRWYVAIPIYSLALLDGRGRSAVGRRHHRAVPLSPSPARRASVALQNLPGLATCVFQVQRSERCADRHRARVLLVSSATLRPMRRAFSPRAFKLST